MDDNPYDDPQIQKRLLPDPETQDALLQTEDMHTLGDIVDARSDQRADLDVTTRGLDPADLAEDDPLKTTVGYAGNFSNDGMGGDRVDDALSTDFNEPEATMAGEYGPNDSDLTSDMAENLESAEEQAPSLDAQEVLSSGVGFVRSGAAVPTGFQEERIGPPGGGPRPTNQEAEPDFSRVDEATGEVSPASGLGLPGAEDADDPDERDVTLGT